MIDNMAVHHRNELYLRLETVNDIGCAVIRKHELLRWYNAERLTGKVWFDLIEKWREVNGNDQSPLFMGETEGEWVFAYGKGLTASPEAYFQPLSSRIKR